MDVHYDGMMAPREQAQTHAPVSACENARRGFVIGSEWIVNGLNPSVDCEGIAERLSGTLIGVPWVCIVDR